MTALEKRMREEQFAREIYGAGEIVFEEGDPADCAYIVEIGWVEVIKPAGASEELLGMMGPGSILGEMALIDDAPRMATVRSIHESVLLRVDRRHFQKRIEAADPFVRKLLRILVQNVRSITDRHVAAIGNERKAGPAR